jgi:tetratricopeptide (TPR) repeat protein
MNFAERNAVYLIIGAIAVVALLAGSLIWRYVDNKKEIEAGERFSQALAVYEQVLKEDGSLYQASELFEKIIQEYNGTSGAVMSLFYAGNCMYAGQDFDNAISFYEKFIESAPQGTHLVVLAYDSLGFCYEGKEDYQRAIEYYAKTVTPAPGLGEMGYLNMARCYEALGDTENSLEIYRRILLEYPDSRRGTFVLEKIKILEDDSLNLEDNEGFVVPGDAGEESIEE